MDGQMFFKTLMSSSSAAAPLIQFRGDDETNCFPVSGKEVTIVTSDADHSLGSAKLQIKNIVNYSWEHRYYPGQLVAHDRSGKYLAYSLKTPNKGCGVVRIASRVKDDKLLIKGMLGPVVDLAFSHSSEEVVIGIVDSFGNMFVYRVVEESSGMQSERIMEILRTGDPAGGQERVHRLVWCPFVPGPDSDPADTQSGHRMLLLTHGAMAEVWSLNTVLEEHGSGPLTPADVEEGLMTIKEIGGEIADATFSPSGEAVAIAVSDGDVKFFQVYSHEDGPPRCLKTWSPHGPGAPLSSLLWLDDHTSLSPETTFWKFAITGSCFNSELKVWCASTWTCLQTIKFQRPQTESSVGLKLKAVLDPTAKFLILSDIDAMLVYVLNLRQTEERAMVVSVGEFASPAGILSLSCEFSGLRMVKQTTEGVEVSTDSNDEDDKKMEKTVVKLFIIHAKSLQECSIIYDNAPASPGSQEPDLVPPPPVLGDLSSSMIQASPDSVASAPPQSPPAASSPRPPILLPDLAAAASKISLLSPEQFKAAVPTPSLVKPDPILTFSGNSSPSREVAGILDDCVKFETPDEEENEEEEEEVSTTLTFQGVKASPKPVNTSSIKFPTPPAPPALVHANVSQDPELMERLETLMVTKLEQMEKRSEARARKDNQAIRQRFDELFMTLSASVSNTIEETVGNEIKRSLPYLVKTSLDGIHKDMNQKINGLETKVVKELTLSGQSKDTISRAVVKNVSEMVDTSFKQAFTQQVAGMERAFGAMLRQVNDQFLAGTREYEATFNRRMGAENKEIKESMTSVLHSISQVNSEMRQVRDVADRLRSDHTNLAKAVVDKKTLSAEDVRRIVAKEINDALASNRQRAGSHTPVTPDVKAISTQTVIKNLLKAGKYNDAFQTALSSSDLAMVMFTCENVNITQVFNQSECPLDQTVLLSLIQQLSVDISDKTQVKHDYLQEALANLDPENQTTKRHLKPVLKQLDASLSSYMQQSPNSKVSRNLKILSMAAQVHLHSN